MCIPIYRRGVYTLLLVCIRALAGDGAEGAQSCEIDFSGLLFALEMGVESQGMRRFLFYPARRLPHRMNEIYTPLKRMH